MPRPAVPRIVDLVVLVAAGLAAWLAAGGGPILGERTTGDRSTRHSIAAHAQSPADVLAGQARARFQRADFASACDGFRRAADEEPLSESRREDVGRCFEGWGWQALRDGHASEAMLLFQQGLRELPASPGLLRGLGLSAVHAGHPDDAVAPLETVARDDDDSEVHLLLARLWESRDDPGRAVAHVRTVLTREPTNEPARRLLAKLERERAVEARFARFESAHFVVRAPAEMDATHRGRVLGQLEAARDRVGDRLGYRPSERTTVVLYPAEDFRRITGVHGWSGGAFDGKIRLPLAAVRRSPEPERLMLHEYAHAAIHRLSRGRAPRWLQEGLAQVLEGSSVDPMLSVPAQPTLAGIETLVTDVDPDRARTGYDLALWVTTDLVDRGGLTGMRDLLAQLGAGTPIGSAMARVYGLSLGELERQWRTFLGG